MHSDENMNEKKLQRNNINSNDFLQSNEIHDLKIFSKYCLPIISH